MQGVRVDPSAHRSPENNKMFVCQAVFGKQRKHGYKRLWVNELDACPDDDELIEQCVCKASKRRPGLPWCVCVLPSGCSSYHIMNVLKARTLAGKKRASEAS